MSVEKESGIVQNKGHKMLAINSMPDHIHIFVGMKPDAAFSDLVRDIKSNSSRWVNDEKSMRIGYEWQEAYGAFSYSHSQIGDVVAYIRRQQDHHRGRSFREEYLELLKKFEIAYDPKYLFDIDNDGPDPGGRE